MPLFSESDEYYNSKLQYLDLSMADISTQGLVELLQRCNYLKKLSLEHIPINFSVCRAIGANQDLQAINFTMCEGLDGRCMSEMLKQLLW